MDEKTNDKIHDKYEEELIERIWTAIVERQNSLNEQMDKSFKRLNREREEGNKLMEESEKNYFRRVDRKNMEMKELDTRIHRQLEENNLRSEDEIAEEERREKRKLTRKRKNRKIRIRTSKNETPEIIAEYRHEDYSYIYDAIRESDFEDEEKQALVEAVSAVQQRFTKSAE